MPVDEALERVRAQLNLDAETEYELLEEIRSHLEEAMADARTRGLDEEEALAEAAARFGVEEVGQELQATHEGWGALEGIAAAALPVLFALLLRWLVFDPAGTFVGWEQMVSRPVFWVIAAAALLVPLLRFPRRRYALISWAVFWGLSVATIVGGAVRR
ncbi:MAG: permease prefix domain 1-containing protein [Chloroflexota bacterium]